MTRCDSHISSTCGVCSFTAQSETSPSLIHDSITSGLRETSTCGVVLFCFVLFCLVLMCFQSGLRCSSHWAPPRACGSQIDSRPLEQETRFSNTLGLNSTWQPMCHGFMHSPETPWKDFPQTRGRPERSFWPRPAGAILHCRTGHRSLKSTTEELGDSELPAGGSASLFMVKHCGTYHSGEYDYRCKSLINSKTFSVRKIIQK